MTKEQLVKALRYCSAVGMCDDCWLTTIQKEFDAQFCDDKLKQEAADLIEQQTARIAERLPKKGEDGRDCTCVHCVVSVMRSCGGNWADGDVGTHVFPAPAMFDVDQKIWHVGMEPAEFTVNALIPLEDSSDNYFVTHWMLYPEAPKEGKS